MQPINDTLEHLYAGEMTPAHAYCFLESNAAALLVDVRTIPEWSFVGCPDISSLGRELIRLSWRLYPTMQRNSAFEQQLAQRVEDKSTPLLFLCRTGGRSLDAAIAMTAFGYKSCFNITFGFEGEKDHDHHRGRLNGWKAEQLSWKQD